MAARSWCEIKCPYLSGRLVHARVLPPTPANLMERQMSTVFSADGGSNVAITAVIAAVVGTALLFLATVLTPATQATVQPAQHVAAVTHAGHAS